MINHIATPLAWIAEGALLRAKAIAVYGSAVTACERRGWEVRGFGRDAEILLGEEIIEWMCAATADRLSAIVRQATEVPPWLN